MRLFYAFLFAAAFSLIPAALLAMDTANEVPTLQDITPPALLSISFDPQEIDTSDGPVTVTVTAHITDDLSGFEGGLLYFRKPGTTQEAVVKFGVGWSKVSGDALDGVYVAPMRLPRYSAYGPWEMYFVSLEDEVGNRKFREKSIDPQDGGGPDWLPLYNGFVFAVGKAVEMPTGRHVFMPALAAH